MVKIKWIVIEGDNGTGKDTLANNIKKDGYVITTYKERARHLENVARSKKNKERFLSFIDYNQFCGIEASSTGNKNIVIRYWCSTIAAAYADHLLDMSQLKDYCHRCIRNLPIPDLVIHLHCDFHERKDRVILRGNKGDNMCKKRNALYTEALNEIMQLFQSRWKTIDSTNLSELEVYEKIQSILKENDI